MAPIIEGMKHHGQVFRAAEDRVTSLAVEDDRQALGFRGAAQ
jgi:hypothetical protein